jgi:SAM-dependent methyltransferase
MIVASQHYTAAFYGEFRLGARHSAEAILPLVLELVSASSIVDVGCGDGIWLSITRNLGVTDILGIDGNYVDASLLQIPPECFMAADLTKPFQLGRTFDLAISLEVAEHLPPECAPAFVESLTKAAPVVLFSAAIPYQGGNNHVNEQWPDMWAKLFLRHGFIPIDCVRKRVWSNETVEYWYAQNAFLFARADVIETNITLKTEFERTCTDQMRLVHPRQYLSLESKYRKELERAENPGLKEASQKFLASLGRSIRWRFGNMLRKRPKQERSRNP